MLKFLRSLLLTTFYGAAGTSGQEAVQVPSRLRQPVQEYYTIVTPTGGGRQDRKHDVNPFLSYTHLGTDFGFLGPAESGIGWAPGMVWAQLPPSPQGWAGMWHSLARLARQPEDVLDFERCYPSWIEAAFQPRVVGLRAQVMGKGELKIEIKGAGENTLWEKKFPIDSAQTVVLTEPLDAAALRRGKLLNWTAEPGADLMIDGLGFELESPPMAFDQWVFAASYAKASRCYSPATGLIRDRAHTEDGAFDSIPATGLFLLATAVASERGVVGGDFARTTLRKSWTTVSALRGPHGLLPHFARRVEGRLTIHPGTEFSTLDTSIFYHSALLAAVVLGETALRAEIVDAMMGTEFGPLRDDEGFVSHGMGDDRRTRLPYRWRDWGGETALVLLHQALSSGGTLAPQMARTGRVHQGAGFIGEIQTLFFPDFDSTQPDAVSGVNWRESRTRLLEDQKAYFQKSQPPSGFARRNGLYGLSAGEGAFGIGYHVGGVDLQHQAIIHPHYVLMSSASETDPAVVYALLSRMQGLNLFPPWGLVENVFADGAEHLPLLGGLNAGFESISAYHLLVRHRGENDSIYEAARTCQELREEMHLFYPEPER